MCNTGQKRGGRKSGRLYLYCLSAAFALIWWIVLSVGVSVEASGRHRHGGHSSGGGIGVGIRINIGPGLRMPSGSTEEPEAPIEVPSWDDTSSEEVSRPSRVEPVVTGPPRKLAERRVPYLAELAMDIDRTLVDLSLTDPENAVKLYKGAFLKAKNSKDVQGQIEAQTNLGHVYYLTAQLERAGENYQRALEQLRQLGRPQQEAVALRNLAATFTAFAEYKDAEKLGLEALRIFTDSNKTRDAQMVLNNIGVLEKNRGRFEKAVTMYERGLEQNPEPDGTRVLISKNLGNLYLMRGQFSEAIKAYEESLQESQKIGDSKAEGAARILEAQAYARWGKLDQALETGLAALQGLAKAGAPTDWAKKVMGDLCLDARRPTEAEPYLKEADYDSSLGRLALVQSDPETAKKHYQQLLKAAEKEGNLDELFTAYTGLGKSFEALKRYRDAEKNYAKAFEITEEIRSTLLLSERRNFFCQKINGFSRCEPAKGLVRVTLKQHRGAESVYPSEATKAREFADNLFLRAKGPHFDVPWKTCEDEMAVNDKLASLLIGLNVIPKPLYNERYAYLTTQIKRAESTKKAFVQKISKEHKGYASVKYPKPVTLARSGIRKGEYVVLFDIVGEGVAVRLLKGKHVVKASLIEWDPDDFEQAVENYRKPFEQARLTAFDPQGAASLYKRLLEEVISEVPQGRPITIIPDGLLALLPFEALVTGGTASWSRAEWGDYPQGLTYLGDVHPILYYRSLTALTLSRTLRQSPKKVSRLLVVADPVFSVTDARLQGAVPEVELAKKDGDRQTILMAEIADESGGCFRLRRLSGSGTLAKNLAKTYGEACDVYTGLEATKSKLVNEIAPSLSNYGAIVFATHGFAGNSIPGIMEPVMALTMTPPGTDGFVTMSEVAGWKMDADVVALTACKTGVGVRLAGEGIMSMGRAFQCAGAKSVAMSLWSVSEESSVLLMDEFFRNLKAGKGKLESWTTARAHVRKSGFDHPFFWAAFVLVGDAQ